MDTRLLLLALTTIGFALIGAVSYSREWTSRDGRYTVEAELVKVEEGQVVLRRDDGSVIRVPLDRLSLGDLVFAREAIEQAKAAAAESPPETKPPVETSPDEKAMAAESEPPQEMKPEVKTSSSQSKAENPTEWQLAPDPAPAEYFLKPDMIVNLSFEDPSVRFVLFPTGTSPFVAVRESLRRGPFQRWDLRTMEVTAEIAADYRGSSGKHALSNNGEYLALDSHPKLGQVTIWSFATGKVLRTISLPEGSGTAVFMDFAASGRIIRRDSRADCYSIYHVETGDLCGKIEPEGLSEARACAISPGGKYMVVHAKQAPALTFHDTSDGKQVAEIDADGVAGEYPHCLVFSPDGKELAAWLGLSKPALYVWDMATGECVLTHRFDADPHKQLNNVYYTGRRLDWFADRSGWLFHGVGVIDRASGKLVWKDEKALQQGVIPPRWIIDSDRMLTYLYTEPDRRICTIPIPKEEIAASQAAVAAGRPLDEVGLPPVVEIDTQGIVRRDPFSVPWKFEPAAPTLPPEAASRNCIPLGEGRFRETHGYFSRADAARVAVGLTRKSPGPAWGNLPYAYRVMGLGSATQAAEFTVPFPTELVDLSPDGTLGLFRIKDTWDRLDVWELESGRHVVGFRPSPAKNSIDTRVEAACFVDENHVVTVSRNRLVGWELPSCRALYSYEEKTGQVAGRSRDHRTLVLSSGRAPFLVDGLTGEPVGNLEPLRGEGPANLLRTSFSSDDKRLAALFSQEEGLVLAIWDLTDGSCLQQPPLSKMTLGLVWCGQDHILLRQRLHIIGHESLFDVNRGIVVWRYTVGSSVGLWTSPDTRFWYMHRSVSDGTTQLVAAELPDQKAGEYLAQQELPPMLLGPGSSLAVKIAVENAPQALPQGWSDLEKMEEQLYQHFSEQMQQRQVNVVVRNPIQLIAGVKEDSESQEVTIRGPLGQGTIVLSATQLIPFVTLLDSDGKPVWEKSHPIEIDDSLKLEARPEGMEMATYVKLKRWEAALHWLRSVDLPPVLFHPKDQGGFGDSVLTPDGNQIRRAPEPKPAKPPNRTACVPARTARRQS
ncbi:MAG: hypothetical protein GXX96_00270 [Planctomycetaceae bacterium]|nr:hypothetical protein [Planctomycetaceae bacterium]